MFVRNLQLPRKQKNSTQTEQLPTADRRLKAIINYSGGAK
jgi:hypothetical protein